MEKASAMKNSLLECLLFYVCLMCFLSSFLFSQRRAILLISIKWLHIDAHNRWLKYFSIRNLSEMEYGTRLEFVHLGNDAALMGN